MQLIQTSSTSRPGAAAPADVFHASSAVIDDGFNVAMRGGVTEADQHGTTLKLLFKFHRGQADFSPDTYIRLGKESF